MHDPNDSVAVGSNWTRLAVALLVVSALSVARSQPTHFPSVSSASYFQNAHSAHDQRPRFDNEVAKWTIPVNSIEEPSPPAFHSAVIPDIAPYAQYHAKWAHFTRPPPIL